MGTSLNWRIITRQYPYQQDFLGRGLDQRGGPLGLQTESRGLWNVRALEKTWLL